MGEAVKVLVAAAVGKQPPRASLWRPGQDGVVGFLVSPEDATWKDVVGIENGDRAWVLAEEEGSYYWQSLPDDLNRVPRVLESTIQIFLRKVTRIPSTKKLGLKTFYSGDALNLQSNYHVSWPDFETHIEDMKAGKWLLLAAPMQSGKSTLLTAIGTKLKELGFLVVLTTLNNAMVVAGNNIQKDESDAAEDFYNMLADKICDQSEGRIKRGTERRKGAALITDLFRAHGTEEEEIVWLVDEGQILNSIYHKSGMAVYDLLAGLREAKRESIARNPLGTYRLASFCLCGLPRLSALIGNCRLNRIRKHVGPYSPSSPARTYDPLRPYRYTGIISPLSKQIEKDDWQVNKEQVGGMLMEFARDRDFLFKRNEDSVGCSKEEHEVAVREISGDIVSLTSGRLGLVGCCCELIQRISIRSYEQWRKTVHDKRLQVHTFNNTLYGQLIRNVADYSDETKQIVMECIQSVTGSAQVDTLDPVLEAIDDGVLMECGRQTVALTSTLLLSTLLESCTFSAVEGLPPPTDSLQTVFAIAITYMDPDVFLRPKSLNSTGQPSEYSIQSQFFMGLNFVLQKKLYVPHVYKVLVEVKEREENGQRRMRMDGFMEDTDAPKQGLELQVGTGKRDDKTIKEHIERCILYGKLHDCEMTYIYFWVGTSDPTGSKGEIEKLAVQYKSVSCWYVQFDRVASSWTMQRFESGKWTSESKACPPKFPKFLLSTADPSWKRQRLD